MKWIRTCQECGHEQEMKSPEGQKSDNWRNAKCRKCKSEALDYGSWEADTTERARPGRSPRMKIGDRVRIKTHRWNGIPNIPIGTKGEVIEVSRYRSVLPIGVMIVNPDDSNDWIDALYNEDELEVIEAETTEEGDK